MIINKNNKKIFIIIIAVILLFLITIIVINIIQSKKRQKFVEQEIQRVKQYTSLTEFQNMDEVSLYLDFKLIKSQESKNENLDYEIYVELPQDVISNLDSSNGYFEKLIQYSAKALNYKDFMVVDEKNKINLQVNCDEQNQVVERYYINNIENYFQEKQKQSKIENYKFVDTINLEITSDELKKVCENNWKTDNLNFGTKESIYRDYDIYFDEGIQVKKINGKIFNILFTEKYKNNVIGNINVNSSIEEIKTILGKPQFESGNLIGYKSNEIYAFFYNNNISIYRVDKYNTDEIAKNIKKYTEDGNIKELVESVKKQWTDYDVYEYDTNYIKLQYALKGLCIKYDNTSKKGAIIYSNYQGKAYGENTLQDLIENKNDIPNSLYIENADLVFETEKNRVNTLDDTTKNNNYSSTIILNTSDKLKTYKSKFGNQSDLYSVRFISINNELPNSELREPITRGIWYDDYNFIYAVKNRGIFAYNTQTHEYKTIKTGNNQFNLEWYENNILYYDNQTLEINL